jgi:hypothetical protein
MEFGPLKVSTMTWTAAITGTIDLDTIFNEVVLATDDGGIHVIDKERTQSRPPGLVLGKKFGCNVTMRVRATQGRQAGQHQALPTAVFIDGR